MIYQNREEAGKLLAKKLDSFKQDDVVVLALPRGGVITAAEVAKYLSAPLDVVLVRKIGHPSDPEYAIGAMVEGHAPQLNPDELRHIDKHWLDQEVSRIHMLLAERKRFYHGSDYQPFGLKDKIVILVDDGIATGQTMLAAVQAVLDSEPKRIVIAVPVASRQSIDSLEPLTHEAIVLDDPANFRGAIGSHYYDFEQVNDEEVKRLLKEVNDDIHGRVTKDRYSEAVIRRYQEFPDHWTRYRPVR